MQQIFLFPIVFYVVAFVIIFILDKVSPGAPDGGPGLGAQALIGVIGISVIWMIVAVVQGFATSGDYFWVALLHFAVLVLVAFRFFR
jgi:hypothetical protein